MSVYLANIEAAALVFPLLALVMTVPYLIVQYRRYSSIPLVSSVIAYSFALYLLCAFFMVVLPLPADRSAFVPYAATPQLVPFNFVGQIMLGSGVRPNDPATWLSLVRQPAFYEAVFNVALTMPLGAYLRYCLRCRWWQALIAGFLTTLFFELTQLTGLWGLYQHPYRLFDVDDLLLNTLGCLVGFWAAGPLMRALPDLRVLRVEGRVAARRASATHRALSFGIDLAITLVAACLISIAIVFASRAAMNDAALATWAACAPWVLLASFALFFVVAPTLLQGRTFGQLLLRLRIVRPDGRAAHWYHYLARYGLLLALALLPAALATTLLMVNDSRDGDMSRVAVFVAQNGDGIVFGWLAFMALWAAALIVRALISAARKRPFVMLNGLISSTRVMTEEGVETLRNERQAVSVACVRQREQDLAEQGTSLATLMERAGQAVADEVRAWIPDPAPVTVLAGSGNNGGDGWVCALALARAGYATTLVTSCLAESIYAEPARSMALAASAAAGQESLPLHVLIDPGEEAVKASLDKAQAVVDAILGTGFSGSEMRQPYKGWIQAANSRRFNGKGDVRPVGMAGRHASKVHLPDKAHHAPVCVAVDVPSGLSADQGTAADACIAADVTVTMLAYKQGLLQPQAQPWVGTCVLADLADPADDAE